MEHIAISVIVPIYNTKPYLAECIESILDRVFEGERCNCLTDVL